ncbi:MAG: TIM barrel protein [Bacteroidetes bacterium]|jgi:sugar phosphate isomerase/epimerase|nr:TIM barrel protein [Bacteroidota bacterium]
MTLSWLTDLVTSDLDRAIHYTLLWGLEGLELRTMGGPADRVPHVNEEKLTRRMEEHDLPVVAVVPGLFEGDLEDRATWMNEVLRLDEVGQFCGRIGCERIVVGAFDEKDGLSPEDVGAALRRAGEAVAPYGARLNVLNTVGSMCPTGAALAEALEAADHPAVRAAWHPAEALQAGEPPEVGVDALDGHVDLVRCCDGVQRQGTWQPRPLGEGGVGWTTQIERLQEQGFDGPISLEIHLEPGPTHGLRMATSLIGMLRSADIR